MTSVDVATTPPSPGQPIRSIRGGAAAMATEVIGNPVRDGALRLKGIGSGVRRVAALGIIVLAGMTVSLLAGSAWRRGTLLVLDTSGRPTLLPAAVLPITLLCLFVAWVVIAWGALLSSAPVRLAVAAGYALVNVSISRVATVSVGRSWPLQYGPALAHAGYLAVPAALVVSTVLELRPEAARRLRPFLLGLAVTGCAALFGSVLWIYVAQVNAGQASAVPTFLDLAIAGIFNLTLPLVLAGAIAVVDFGYSLATAATVPARAVSARAVPTGIAKAVVATLIVAGAVLQIIKHWSTVTNLASQRPGILVRSVGALVLFAVAAVWYRRLRGDHEVAGAASTHVAYASALLLAAPLIVLTLRPLAGLVFADEIHWMAAASALGGNAGEHLIATWGASLVWLAALVAAGVVLLGARRRVASVQTAAGFAIVAAWALSASLLDAVGRDPGLNVPVISVIVAMIAAVVAVAGWRRLSAGAVFGLGALVLFAWLVSRRGLLVQTIGQVLGAPDVLLIVFGLIYTLGADCSYAHGDTRRFPRPARVLLLVGYLVLSATLANWANVTHARDLSSAFQGRGFALLSLPLAAWYAMARHFKPTPRPPRSQQPAPEKPIVGAATEPAGDGA